MYKRSYKRTMFAPVTLLCYRVYAHCVVHSCRRLLRLLFRKVNNLSTTCFKWVRLRSRDGRWQSAREQWQLIWEYITCSAGDCKKSHFPRRGKLMMALFSEHIVKIRFAISRFSESPWGRYGNGECSKLPWFRFWPSSPLWPCIVQVILPLGTEVGRPQRICATFDAKHIMVWHDGGF